MVADDRVHITGLDDSSALRHLGDHRLTAIVQAPGVHLAILVEGERVLLACANRDDVIQRLVDGITLTDVLRVLGVGVR